MPLINIILIIYQFIKKMLIDIVFVAVVIALLIAIYKLKFQAPSKTQKPLQQTNLEQRHQPAQARWNQQEHQSSGQSQSESEGDKHKGDVKKQMRKQQKQREKQQKKQAMEHYLKSQRQKRERLEEQETEKERQEEERRQKEEQCYQKLVEEEEKRKKAEYDKWKNAFVVQESGKAKDSAEEQERKRKEFKVKLQATIKGNKLSLLEDLSHRFKLSTQQVINEIKKLQNEERVTGIFDERGKYLYIEDKEWEAIKNYIQARGRIKKTDIIQECSRIIKIPDITQDTQNFKELIENEAE